MTIPHVERWVQAIPGVWFGRLLDGAVAICRTDGRAPHEGGEVGDCRVIDAGIWASVVLELTYFRERPNDWQAFMDHHQGRRDLLEAAKDCERLENTLERIQREDAARAGLPAVTGEGWDV